LQRLFLMNSDFMQVEAEELAKRVANEVDNRTRIKKAYQYIYGRDATEEEIALGLDYLRSEPMLEYDETKARAPIAPAGGRRGARPAAPAATEVKAETVPMEGSASNSTPGAIPPLPGAANATEAAKTEAAKADAPMPEGGEAVAAADAMPNGMGMGMGMMGGMGGRRGQGGGAPEVKYDVTVWGRYAKILYSSSEFLFIN
jgi:hypothetical protein